MIIKYLIFKLQILRVNYYYDRDYFCQCENRAIRRYPYALLVTHTSYMHTAFMLAIWLNKLVIIVYNFAVVF